MSTKTSFAAPALTSTARQALLAQYQASMTHFSRESSESTERIEQILAFIRADSHKLPHAEQDDKYALETLVHCLKPVSQWCFVEERILAFMGQKVCWRFTEGKYEHGFYETFFEWLAQQIRQEQTTDTFALVQPYLAQIGIQDDISLLEYGLDELYDVLLDENHNPTSAGRFVLQHTDKYATHLLNFKPNTTIHYPLTELMLRYKPDVCEPYLSELMHRHINGYSAANIAARIAPIDFARFEPYIVACLEMPKLSLANRMHLHKTLFMQDPLKYQASTLAAVIHTLKALESIPTHGEDSVGRMFIWHRDFVDGRSAFIKWALSQFGHQIQSALAEYVQNTKTINLNIIQSICQYLGQDGLPIAAEALDMNDNGDLEQHFARTFQLLSPLDYSAYIPQIWNITTFKSLVVNKLAAQALAKQGTAMIPQALKRLDDKNAKIQLGAVLVLLHFHQEPQVASTLLQLLHSPISAIMRKEINQTLHPTLTQIQEIAHALAKKQPKPLRPWLDLHALPALRWQNSDQPLSIALLHYLFLCQDCHHEIEWVPQVKTVLDACRTDDLIAFTRALYQQVATTKIDAKTRLALSIIGYCMDESIITELTNAALTTNLNAVNTLALSNQDAAVKALDKICKQFAVKYPNVREAAENALSQIAKRRNVSESELLEIVIPDFGFTRRTQIWPIGTDDHHLFIDHTLNLVFESPTGKQTHTIPKAASADQKQAFKQLKADLREGIKITAKHANDWMINQRRWDKHAWIERFLNHPILFNYARTLIWGIYSQDQLLDTFQVTERVTLHNSQNQPIDIYSDDWESDFWTVLGMHTPKPYALRAPKSTLSIGLIHPIELEESVLTHWQQQLTQQSIEQPIPQLWRPLFRAHAREQKMDWRFEEQNIQHTQFSRLGWRRGSVIDAGEISGYKRHFHQAHIDAFLMLQGLNVQDPYSQGQAQQFFFVPAGQVYTGSYLYDEPRDESDPRLLKAADVPAIVYSETVADLHALLHKETSS